MKCPKCGSKNTAPILYGSPVFSDELQQAIADHKVYIGGCCVSEMDPTYHCFDCNRHFGSPPLLINRKHVTEDYRDIVTAIRFSYGGFFQGHTEVYIEKKNGEIFQTVHLPFSDYRDDGIKLDMTINEWNKLVNKLYCKMYLHEWKKRYVDSLILDGEQWGLEIRLTNNRKRTYYGDNEYPPYWNELKRAFRSYIKDAESKRATMQ